MNTKNKEALIAALETKKQELILRRPSERVQITNQYDHYINKIKEL